MPRCMAPHPCKAFLIPDLSCYPYVVDDLGAVEERYGLLSSLCFVT